ncbi:MAG: hypothetical protein BAJALOKI3v1_290033 [Promethearchaeota archaeon]|nr:MAG: hypothetical protein BAJALOKI3v1_290033 [Candidatus Lokiarchaeota archaeon]
MGKKYYKMPKFASSMYSRSEKKKNNFLLRIYPQIADDFIGQI